MTREIIENFRFIVTPYVVNRFKEINYEGQGGSDAKEFMSDFNEICDLAIKALEQEPCEDEYIKVPKKALKYRTAGMVAYNAEWLKNHFDIERAVICGAQEPCDVFDEYGNYKYPSDVELTEPNTATSVPYGDVIGRQAVLDKKELVELEDGQSFYCISPEDVETLPPVTPQPKTGYWIRVDKDKLKCSECDVIHFIAQYPRGKIAWCPNCGTKMVEPQERSDKG